MINSLYNVIDPEDHSMSFLAVDRQSIFDYLEEIHGGQMSSYTLNRNGSVTILWVNNIGDKFLLEAYPANCVCSGPQERKFTLELEK